MKSENIVKSYYVVADRFKFPNPIFLIHKTSSGACHIDQLSIKKITKEGSYLLKKHSWNWYLTTDWKTFNGKRIFLTKCLKVTEVKNNYDKSEKLNIVSFWDPLLQKEEEIDRRFTTEYYLKLPPSLTNTTFKDTLKGDLVFHHYDSIEVIISKT